MDTLYKELEKAKENVLWLLNHDGLVDFHGLAYWAQRIETLREEIKSKI